MRVKKLNAHSLLGNTDQIETCHCERSEAIQNVCEINDLWIATALRASE
jgi:hypothetical protein